MKLTDEIKNTEFCKDDDIQILIECGNSHDGMDSFVDKTEMLKFLLLNYGEGFTLDQLYKVCKSICPKKLIYLNYRCDNNKFVFCCNEGNWSKWELKVDGKNG